jgi:hypothetical protein
MQHSGHCDKAGAGGYNETTFIQTADALVDKGLAALGYVRTLPAARGRQTFRWLCARTVV